MDCYVSVYLQKFILAIPVHIFEKILYEHLCRSVGLFLKTNVIHIVIQRDSFLKNVLPVLY